MEKEKLYNDKQIVPITEDEFEERYYYHKDKYRYHVRNLEDLLDWLVGLDIQHYKTESSPDYTPDGKSHFHLKGSLDRFTSIEMIKIFDNRADDELMQRWNYAIFDFVNKRNN